MAPKKLAYAVIAVLSAAALLLTGCTSGGQKVAADPRAPVTLTWWTGQAGEPQAVLQKLAKDFSRLHPNVTIRLSSGAPTTTELLQKLTAAFATTNYPDLSYTYGSWTGQLAASGRTLDFTDQVKDPSVDWTEFSSTARHACSPGGKVIGFPSLVDDLALVYNKKLFDDNHIPYPTANWTWDDFRAAAKKITNPATQTWGTAFHVSGGEDTTWRLWPQLWQLGGKIAEPNGKAAFNSPAGVAALDFWRAMAVDDKSVFIDQTDQKAEPLFASGKMGLFITGPWSLYTFVQAKTPYGVQILPGYNGDHQTVSGPDVWTAFDHQDPNRAYWTFQLLKWLSSPQIDPRWTMATGNLPLRKSERGSAEYKQFVKDFPGVDVMVDNLANDKQARPTDDWYVPLSRAVGEAIGQVLQGTVGTKEALNAAARKSDASLAKN
ncbi:ABC transporter substrate-binding protein [Fodinicola acaciae]|uniref:ABC transporter substrate-binding protein n=1 Tax=Fodinicola acaciae TaxID=2681555 RepID=UPI0013D476E9|nr:ABC transporter substrate-binding protein [Fodinicola acaciae]